VTLADKTQYKARILGADDNNDLALLKITPKGKLPFLRLGDSENLKVGQKVIAIGNPFDADPEPCESAAAAALPGICGGVVWIHVSRSRSSNRYRPSRCSTTLLRCVEAKRVPMRSLLTDLQISESPASERQLALGSDFEKRQVVVVVGPRIAPCIASCRRASPGFAGPAGNHVAM